MKVKEERWEEVVAKCKNSTDSSGENRIIPEDMLMTSLETMCPEEFEKHLQLCVQICNLR